MTPRPTPVPLPAPGERPLRFLQVGGQPVTWLGANFWSRVGGPLMWRGIDEDVLLQELRVLREHGLTMTRSFFYWPDTMPEPDRLEESVLERFETFLDLHRQLGLTTVPTFVVGHMSGENWDPVWRHGRDLYGDTWMVARQAWYTKELVARFADHPSVAGWLVSNEMPNYGGYGDVDVVTSWAELMVQAVRAGGGRQPVSLGDGTWGIEVTGQDNGFSLRHTRDIVDFVGPHVYRMERDVVRQHLKAAFVCELAAVAGRPVILEEFGVTSDFASDEHAAHYYRQSLHLSLLGGATGWIGWNNTDFDNIADQDPYRHHAFELHFGLTRVDGTPKPALLEMHAFAGVLDVIDLPRCRRWPAEAGLVVPAYLETGVPFTLEEEERTPIFAALEQAYLAAREVDLPVQVVREVDGIPDGLGLYLVPSVKALTAPTWRHLGELARGGATVYASHGLGDVEFQRGPWWFGLEETFGVRHSLAYGDIEPLDDAELQVTFERDFGGLQAGETVAVPIAGSQSTRAMLPVAPLGAEVIARDQHGRVVLTRNPVGAGSAVLSTIPFEAMAAARPRANPEVSWRLYDALADAAGVERRVRVKDPSVLVDGLQHEGGRTWVWLVSESDHRREVVPALPAGTMLCTLSGETLRGAVTLPPYGVVVLELTEDVSENDSATTSLARDESRGA